MHPCTPPTLLAFLICRFMLVHLGVDGSSHNGVPHVHHRIRFSAGTGMRHTTVLRP